MKANLTEKLIKSLQPSEKVYEVVDTSLSCFVLRVEKSGHMSFFVVYRNKQGSRNRVKLGTYGQITLTQARDLAKQKLGAIASGIDPQQEKKAVIEEARQAKQDLTTLNEFIEQYYKPWVLMNRKSADHTLMLLDKYFSQWNKLPMRSFTRKQVESWQLSERDRGLLPSAINRSLNALRSVFTRATELGILATNPLSKVPKLQEPKDIHVRFLNVDELKRLLSALDDRNQQAINKRQSANTWRKQRGLGALPEILPHQYADYFTPLVLLTIHTGLRRGELFQLKWRDIDFTHNRLTVRAANAKSNKTRHIPLNTNAVTLLMSWKETCSKDNELVFPSPTGGMLTTIKTAWSGLVQKADISDFRFHDLRHHFASMLVMGGKDLNTVRELLGHSDFTTTLRYAHLADSHKADAVALLEY